MRLGDHFRLRLMRLALLISAIIPVGCADQASRSDSIRAEQSGAPVDREPTVSLHPDFPVVEGLYQMTERWSIVLPDQFNRRFDDGSLVIWRPGFTIWISIWGNNHNQSLQEQLESIQTGISPNAFAHLSEKTNDTLRYAYQLSEEAGDDRQPAFYGFVISDSGYVQLAIYFDVAKDVEVAKAIWQSIS